jgi:hypothetical protein
MDITMGLFYREDNNHSSQLIIILIFLGFFSYVRLDLTAPCLELGFSLLHGGSGYAPRASPSISALCCRCLQQAAGILAKEEEMRSDKVCEETR